SSAVPVGWKRVAPGVTFNGILCPADCGAFTRLSRTEYALGMKVLFCGDIVGRSGREAVTKNVPRLRRELGLDFVVANGENAAAGFGITAKICAELHGAGGDCITTGNHVWEQRETIP